MANACDLRNAYDSSIMVTYDVAVEEALEGPFYDPIYQAELQKDREIARAATNALKRADLFTVHGDNLARLIQDGESLSEFEVSSTRTIAILGGSGEGKSSLINSLLHYPEIAKCGDIGAACTSIVTEYRLKTANHKAPITIDVEYLSVTEIEELLKELLWSFRRMYLPNAEDENIIQSEYDQMERESAEAWSSLEAAFSHHEEFSKDWLTKDMTEEGLAMVTDQVIQWSHELDWPAGADSGKWTSTADTADECYEKTGVFMEDRFWPFTKIIRVYIEAQILKSGIILADLPGLHDTNLARVKATQDYLLRCDHIFVVARISRAITNQSLKSSLLSVVSKHAGQELDGSRGESMKIAAVCTNSEDINEKSARREFCGPNNRISPEDMAELDQDIAKEMEQGNRQSVKNLRSRQRLLLINARNMHVKEGLQKAYSAEIPKGVLEVFCVSNTSYEKYAMKGDIEMVQASGIPEDVELSKFHPARGAKPACQTMEAMIDRSIYFTLFGVKNEVLGAVSQSKIDFNDVFQSLIISHIDQESPAWEKAAQEEGLSWFNWYWSTVSTMHKYINCRLTPDVAEENVDPLLIDGIGFKIGAIEYEFSQAVEKLVKGVEIICSKASEANQSSYIVKIMTPAYRSAAQQFGKGMAARQRTIVQGRIEEGLFSKISMDISKDIKAEVKTSFGAVKKELDNIFVRIETDIRVRLAMEEQSCEKGDTTREDKERRKADLACELQDLKRQHEEAPGSIDFIQPGALEMEEVKEEGAAL
ncbi:hypothetical protein VE04_00611 [Pseudogymnoascus sp. 24MN13]|nr:hypothetical protein VE04_00611 [Pseudogymnoascus sp. 24MN13]